MDIVSKLHELFEESEIRGNEVHFPDWNVTVKPSISELKEGAANLSFYVTSPVWEAALYECCVGMGDSQEKAVGMALGSFAFGMMSGIRHMMKDMSNSCGHCGCEMEAKSLMSEFVGHHHEWRVYEGDVVTMGDGHKESRSFWSLISEKIAQRLGNQRMCYIKIYGCKFGDQTIGECRFNDVVCSELSEVIANYVADWEVENFMSQKQFIFLAQEESTLIPYPHSASQIANFTKEAIELFKNSQSNEDYQQYLPRLAERISDNDLAQELSMFLPEMCAESAFENITYKDQVTISVRDRQMTVYKSQIASYYPILRALHAEFGNGTFTNELYNDYISISSIYSVICDAKEKGVDMAETGGDLSLSFGVYDEYQLR
ncbi:DUF6348 family protein [Leminorella grimontii]|uniref:DUF6348 family protein n=1 Tax=Leminorella grimontii TaxID=82981 RepID=UPI00208CB7B4|nr:DUF6348 family protein [Leminorella grimontii]GKX60270.1 hypothetical protein SOASR031_25850 [Leminorella grimontii]